MALLTPDTSTEIEERVVADYRNAYEPMGQVQPSSMYEPANIYPGSL